MILHETQWLIYSEIELVSRTKRACRVIFALMTIASVKIVVATVIVITTNISLLYHIEIAHIISMVVQAVRPYLPLPRVTVLLHEDLALSVLLELLV